MRLDVTLKRQSNFVVGIAVIAITSFFVAFALVVGGLCVHLPNGSTISDGIPEPNLGNEHFVPVAYKYEIDGLNTAKGEIELIDYNFPYFDETGQIADLPLCITNEMAATWWFDLNITGGYTPEDTTGFWPCLGITFWQDQDKDGIKERIQGWNLHWTLEDDPCDNYPDCCCEERRWRGVPAWCGNVVCLDSNQYPTLSGGLEYWVSTDPSPLPDYIPGKDVMIKVGLLFRGCELDSQQFAYILAQKRCFTPNPPTSD